MNDEDETLSVTISSFGLPAFGGSLQCLTPLVGCAYAARLKKEYVRQAIHSVSAEIAGRTLTIETGRSAEQADGAVTVRYGATLLLATVVGAKEFVRALTSSR
jgi:hypothetical protein